MSKTRYYFWILAIVIITVLAGYILNIAEIKQISRATLANAVHTWILIPAVISAFLFGNFRHYWLTILIIGLIDAVCIHLFLNNGTAAGILTTTTAIRVFAFIAVVYVMNLLKLLISRIL